MKFRLLIYFMCPRTCDKISIAMNEIPVNLSDTIFENISE